MSATVEPVEGSGTARDQLTQPWSIEYCCDGTDIHNRSSRFLQHRYEGLREFYNAPEIGVETLFCVVHVGI